MNVPTGPSVTVDLAHEPDFWLGALSVSPSACRVDMDGRIYRLEPRVMEVLVMLARAAGHTVTRDELVDACWEGRFVSDDVVTRVIGKVRNLSREVEPAPFVLETVPKVGFRLIAPGDETPESVLREGPASPPLAPAKAWGRPWFHPRLAATILAVLLIAVAGVVLWRAAVSTRLEPPAWQTGRVEVMRFEPLQNDPVLRRYSVALGDAVVRVLTSTGVDTAQQTLARDLGGGEGRAEFRIAGTVDREGDTYVVNAQVIDRRSGAVLWSGRIDRAVEAGIGLQEEVANTVGDVLHCALWRRAASNRPVSTAVFGLVLNACGLWRDSSLDEDYSRLLEATRRLTRAAPRLSAAHSMYATAAAMAALSSNAAPTEVESLRAAARASAQRALRLDPKNGEAYHAIAVSYGVGGHWLERERNLRRALELNTEVPGSRNLYVGLLREVGRQDEALKLNARTLASDPFSPFQLANFALANAAIGDTPRSDAALRRLDLIRPRVAREVRWTIALWYEDPRKALAKVRSLAGETSTEADLACFERYLERLPRAIATGMRGLPPVCDNLVRDWRVRMLARQGDVDGAYAELAQPLPQARRHTIFLFYPEMKAFRQDPRFMPLAKRLGLADYWLQTGRWPDFCREPDLPYDCGKVARAL
jgi:DNA-binding winged helix-turn-helix (wHTH) protein/TolB-like protein/Tfp pilus assembly protein PilF